MGMYCFGMDFLETGQSLLPTPPESIIWIMAILIYYESLSNETGC